MLIRNVVNNIILNIHRMLNCLYSVLEEENIHHLRLHRYLRSKKHYIKKNTTPQRRIVKKTLLRRRREIRYCSRERGFSSRGGECVQQLVQTTMSSSSTAVAVIVIREQKLSWKLYTRKTGFGYRPTAVWSVVLIYYTSLGLARNSPKSITGKYRLIGLPEREGKNLNNSKPVHRRWR